MFLSAYSLMFVSTKALKILTTYALSTYAHQFLSTWLHWPVDDFFMKSVQASLTWAWHSSAQGSARLSKKSRSRQLLTSIVWSQSWQPLISIVSESLGLDNFENWSLEQILLVSSFIVSTTSMWVSVSVSKCIVSVSVSTLRLV